MPAWRRALDEWFRAHHGVVSTPTLLRLGCSEATVYRMVERHELVRLAPGVFVSAQWPIGPMQQMGAACARNPAAMIGFTTACNMWSFRNVRDRGPHVMVPHGCSPEIPGIVVHRCRRIDPVDIVQRPDGIRLTSPPRSLFDSADMLGVSKARSVMEQILNDKLCTVGTLLDTFRRLAHPNRPGTHTMTRVIASRPMWREALQSHLEQVVLEAIERVGLPSPVAQCPIRLADGSLIHADFGWPDAMVALEVDDPAWHDGADQGQRDARRDRKATVVGWAIVRVVRLDVEGPLLDAISDVGMILARRQRPAA